MNGILGFDPEELEAFTQSISSFPDVGEGEAPTKALLFKGGAISMISGRSGDLHSLGFEPFAETHFNTQFALTITQTLATFHATLKAKGKTSLNKHPRDERTELKREKAEFFSKGYSLSQDAKDEWTSQISRRSLVRANLSILIGHFRQVGVSSRVTDKLESIQGDVHSLTKFLRFASAMQSETRLQSVGPVCMSDVWVPRAAFHEGDEEILVIRLRGGPHLQAPPLRDTAWVWLTLLRPEVLQDRYMELCENYCSTYNATLNRLGNGDTQADELTLFDIMRDLGESFLHGFLTIVHKSTVSGIWSFDRKLYTNEGVQSLAEAIGFLVDNGIIGALFVA